MRLLLFLPILLGLQLQAQDQIKTTDAPLMEAILTTLTTHPKVAPHLLIPLKDFAGKPDGVRRLRSFVEDPTLVANPTQAYGMLFVDRNNQLNHWADVLWKMGMKGIGILTRPDYLLCYGSYGVGMQAASPLLLTIEKAGYSNAQCYQINCAMTATPWRNYAFRLSNPPSHLYRFELCYEKKQGVWALTTIQRKKIQKYQQSLQQIAPARRALPSQ